MANPCLQPKASDFRGYPASESIKYWKTTAANPCTINVSTLVEEELTYDLTSDRYYVSSTLSLANGKYFTNPDGNGQYLSITNGVLEDGVNAVNHSCTRLPNNEATLSYFEDTLGGEKTSFDTYNNYIFVAYGNLNVVVRYPKNTTNTNPVGRIVAGSLGKFDLGLDVNSFLWYPRFIKVNPSNGSFVVFSDGIHKSFKVFSVDGVFQYKCNDATSGSVGDLNYKQPASGEPAWEPANWNGLIGRITQRDFGSSESQIRQSVNALWSVEQIDFVTVPNAEIDIVFVGIWNFNNTTKDNRYEIYSLTLHPEGVVFGIPTIIQNFYHSSGYMNQGDELIMSFCVSKMVPTGTGQARVEMVAVYPRWTGSFKTFGVYELRATASKTAVSGFLPGLTGFSDVDKGAFYHGIGSQIFSGNMKSEVRRNSSGHLIVHTGTYLYSKWDYRMKVALQWTGTLSITGAVVGLGFAVKDLITPIYEFKSGILQGATVMGVIGVVAALAGAVMLFNLFDPPKEASYAVVKIFPSTGSTTTTYNMEFGHWVSYFNDGSNSWVNIFKRNVSHMFAVQVGSVSNANEIYATQFVIKNLNMIVLKAIRKGGFTDKKPRTTILLD